MPSEIKVEYHKLETRCGCEGTSGHPVHRAMIRFAPGPYGTMFTDAYMGREGAEMAVDAFCRTFSVLGVLGSAR